jgi:diadenosine tetraphosphatase ApaH/serine/threonine PP2A family protein phosphatase
VIFFSSECIRKFGKDLGAQVWEEINKVFDVLPIAAVVDSKIFCIHGGIPPMISERDNTLAEIARIPCPLRDPESESPLAWEILWNDPIA